MFLHNRLGPSELKARLRAEKFLGAAELRKELMQTNSYVEARRVLGKENRAWRRG